MSGDEHVHVLIINPVGQLKLSVAFEFVLLKSVEGFGEVAAEEAIVAGKVDVDRLDVGDDSYLLLGRVLAAGALVGVGPVGRGRGHYHRLDLLLQLL